MHMLAKMGERHSWHRSEYLDAYRPPPQRRGAYVFSTRAKSYAAAVYWRIKLSEHESAVSLIAGKARVAPFELYRPSLELKAALLSAQLSLYGDNLVNYDAPCRAHNSYVAPAEGDIALDTRHGRAKRSVRTIGTLLSLNWITSEGPKRYFCSSAQTKN
ncbi:hypothetical protein EVAR_68034_1 [Eumeta japonica]|uniref:Uncharacterized protein n=1 Tax=Eumeta variegata TaxID=151549 RepID=A0A4C1SJD7_EUMVA|nr:hypothetical protein EVAR_68034_1 [Eumeta japonica]